MRLKLILICGLAASTLAGCGDNLAKQTFFGAGAGYAGAKILGLDPQGGAIVGAAGNIIYCQENPSKC